jgi:hypothetical protein
MITVTIPVGPYKANIEWLDLCVDSVIEQDDPPAEILFIGDQARIDLGEYAKGVRRQSRIKTGSYIEVNVWETPWLSGVAHAFNFGVALARNEHVVMLGSDDMLEPWAISDLKAAIGNYNDPHGYYFYDVKYMDTGEVQSLPCNGAAVTKALWKLNGGFPVESAAGAPDTMLISIMIGNGRSAGNLRHIESSAPPYLYRRHPDTDTATRPRIDLGPIRDILTSSWKERRARLHQ